MGIGQNIPPKLTIMKFTSHVRWALCPKNGRANIRLAGIASKTFLIINQPIRVFNILT